MQGLLLDSDDRKVWLVMEERMGSSGRRFCGQRGVVDGEVATTSMAKGEGERQRDGRDHGGDKLEVVWVV